MESSAGAAADDNVTGANSGGAVKRFDVKRHNKLLAAAVCIAVARQASNAAQRSQALAVEKDILANKIAKNIVQAVPVLKEMFKDRKTIAIVVGPAGQRNVLLNELNGSFDIVVGVADRSFVDIVKEEFVSSEDDVVVIIDVRNRILELQGNFPPQKITIDKNLFSTLLAQSI